MYIIMYCVNKENEKKKKKAHNKWNTAKDNILFCDCHVFWGKKKKDNYFIWKQLLPRAHYCVLQAWESDRILKFSIETAGLENKAKEKWFTILLIEWYIRRRGDGIK